MKTIKIDNYKIGNNYPPFIIAEAGINHNGDVDKALKMIDIAKASGSTAIKFQTFKAEELVADPNLNYTYTSQGKQITESMLEMFKRHEFSKEQWLKIKQKCDQEKIIFLSSPSTKSDLELLIGMGIKAIKIGSDDFTNIPLIREYSTTGLPLILSCGMSDLMEIKETINRIIGYLSDAVGYAENIQSELERAEDGKGIDIDEDELGYLIHDFTDLSKHTGERSNFSDEQNLEFVRSMQDLLKFNKKIEKMNEHSKGLLY